MKRRCSLALAAGLLLAFAADGAVADDSPSVLVNETPLVRGSLPEVLTVYGTIGAAATDQRILPAPIQAEVSDVYVHAGALVAQGTPLMRLVPTPSSTLAYRESASMLKLSTILAQRTQALVAGHLATQEQLFQAEKDEADARAAFDTLTAQGADGPHIVAAPIKALVTTLGATPGAIVSEGDMLAELVPPNALSLTVGIIPSEAGLVEPGDSVALTPIGGGEATSGSVAFRTAVVDATDGLVAVEINVPPGQLLLGETVRADITSQKVSGYVVPHDAILVNSDGETYIVQDDHMTAKLVPVTVLASSDGQDVVSGSLEAGAPVVLSGNYQLNDGDKIRHSGSAGDASQ